MMQLRRERSRMYVFMESSDALENSSEWGVSVGLLQLKTCSLRFWVGVQIIQGGARIRVGNTAWSIEEGQLSWGFQLERQVLTHRGGGHYEFPHAVNSEPAPAWVRLKLVEDFVTQAPRQLLASWVAKPRPNGCSEMTWGRALKGSCVQRTCPVHFKVWSKIE